MERKDELRLKALKVAYAFNQNEIISLVSRYGGLAHLRVGLKFKTDKSKTRLNVYIATPYDTMLNRGFALDEVLAVARDAKEKAVEFFAGAKFEYFSPVICFGGSDMSREEAMKRCFNELLKADFLYIADCEYSGVSDGIYEEYKFAKSNGIAVVFQSEKLREDFKQRQKDESDANKAF